MVDAFHVIHHFLHSTAASRDLERQMELAQLEEFDQHIHRQNLVHSHTIADISRGTGLEPRAVENALRDSDEDFVHWKHPEHPHLNRYALQEHAQAHGLHGFEPGTGF